MASSRQAHDSPATHTCTSHWKTCGSKGDLLVPCSGKLDWLSTRLGCKYRSVRCSCIQSPEPGSRRLPQQTTECRQQRLHCVAGWALQCPCPDRPGQGAAASTHLPPAWVPGLTSAAMLQLCNAVVLCSHMAPLILRMPALTSLPHPAGPLPHHHSQAAHLRCGSPHSRPLRAQVPHQVEECQHLRLPALQRWPSADSAVDVLMLIHVLQGCSVE